MTTEGIRVESIIPRQDGSAVNNLSDQSNLQTRLRPIEFRVLCGGITGAPPKIGLFDVGVKISEED